jgi:hypothetical protein
VHIQAPTREDAVEILAATMIESVARTFTNPHLQFVEMKLGLYPAAYSREQEPVSQGSPITGASRRSTSGSCGSSTRRVRATGCGCTRSPWIPVSSSWTGCSPTATATGSSGLQGDRRDLGGAGRVDRGLDGVLDSFYQEVYLDPESQIDVQRLVQHVSPDGLENYLEQIAGEIARYSTEGHENYGKVAKRLYNITRILRRDADASYLRQLFDDPPARLLPGRRHHARASARPSAPTGSTARRSSPSSRPSRAPSPTATPARTARRSGPGPAAPEMDEDELIAAADRIAVASNVQVSGYFQQKIAESPGLTTVYDLILKEAPGHQS